MINYRIEPSVDWQILDGKTLRIDVSEHYIVGVIVKTGQSIVIGRAIQHKSKTTPIVVKESSNGEGSTHVEDQIAMEPS